MLTTYKKTLYGGSSGYQLFHTVGLDAGNSTIDYPHLCPDYMLFFFMHGKGSIKIEGNHYNIQAGDIFVTNPDELFHCAIDNSTYHERIVLHIQDTFLQQLPCDSSPLFRIFRDREKGVCNHIPANLVRKHGLDEQLAQILNFVQTPTAEHNILVLCKISELLLNLSQFITADSQMTPATVHSPIEPILSYLNIHFTENISITSVAEQFNLNCSYLSHLFKDHTGMSLWNYVILRRLHLFNNLLRQNRSIEDACYSVGFQNYSNFFRLYKKYMGMTPTEFKHQNIQIPK